MSDYRRGDFSHACAGISSQDREFGADHNEWYMEGCSDRACPQFDPKYGIRLGV
jgi:hypothetical protein